MDPDETRHNPATASNGSGGARNALHEVRDEARDLARDTKEEARKAWQRMTHAMSQPRTGAWTAGIAVLAAGAMVGASEAAIAAIAAYAVFRMLSKRAKKHEHEPKPAH